MKLRTFRSADAHKLVELWNLAHPAYPLTEALMAKKIFLDANFSAEALLVAEENGQPIGFAYTPHRLVPIDRNIPIDTQIGYLAYFAVHPSYSLETVGGLLLQACENHHKDAGRTRITTAYAPLYHTQGFSETHDAPYIRLFQSMGYASRGSCRRKLDLTALSVPQNYEARKQQLEKEGVWIGALPYALLADFVSSENEFTKKTWPVEFRVRLANDPDLAKARVAVYDGKLIGACIFGDPNSDAGRFGPFGVTDSFRGRGIGFVLFWDCLLEMQRRQIPYTWAQWTPTTGAASSLYDKSGFLAEDSFLSFSKDL